MSDVLDVVTCYYNSSGSELREILMRQFFDRMTKESRVRLTLVTVGTGPEFVVFNPEGTAYHVSLGEKDTGVGALFLKENLLNIGIHMLPKDSKFVAWIDCDTAFANPLWVEHTIESLRHYDIVQLYGQCIDLDKFNQIDDGTKLLRSFGHFVTADSSEAGLYEWMKILTPYGHAWAATKQFLDKTQGLCDSTPFVTAGDDFTAWSLFGLIEEWAARKGAPDEFVKPWLEWQDKAKGARVGCLNGLLYHYWHGSRETRGYESQWNIVRQYPEYAVLLRRNVQGVWTFETPCTNFERDLRAFVKARS